MNFKFKPLIAGILVASMIIMSGCSNIKTVIGNQKAKEKAQREIAKTKETVVVGEVNMASTPYISYNTTSSKRDIFLYNGEWIQLPLRMNNKVLMGTAVNLLESNPVDILSLNDIIESKSPIIDVPQIPLYGETLGYPLEPDRLAPDYGYIGTDLEQSYLRNGYPVRPLTVISKDKSLTGLLVYDTYLDISNVYRELIEEVYSKAEEHASGEGIEGKTFQNLVKEEVAKVKEEGFDGNGLRSDILRALKVYKANNDIKKAVQNHAIFLNESKLEITEDMLKEIVEEMDKLSKANQGTRTFSPIEKIKFETYVNNNTEGDDPFELGEEDAILYKDSGILAKKEEITNKDTVYIINDQEYQTAVSLEDENDDFYKIAGTISALYRVYHNKNIYEIPGINDFLVPTLWNGILARILPTNMPTIEYSEEIETEITKSLDNLNSVISDYLNLDDSDTFKRITPQQIKPKDYFKQSEMNLFKEDFGENASEVYKLFGKYLSNMYRRKPLKFYTLIVKDGKLDTYTVVQDKAVARQFVQLYLYAKRNYKIQPADRLLPDEDLGREYLVQMTEPIIDTYSNLCDMFKAAGISETKFFYKNTEMMNKDDEILNFYTKEIKVEDKDKKEKENVEK